MFLKDRVSSRDAYAASRAFWEQVRDHQEGGVCRWITQKQVLHISFLPTGNSDIAASQSKICVMQVSKQQDKTNTDREIERERERQKRMAGSNVLSHRKQKKLHRPARDMQAESGGESPWLRQNHTDIIVRING